MSGGGRCRPGTWFSPERRGISQAFARQGRNSLGSGGASWQTIAPRRIYERFAFLWVVLQLAQASRARQRRRIEAASRAAFGMKRKHPRIASTPSAGRKAGQPNGPIPRTSLDELTPSTPHATPRADGVASHCPRHTTHSHSAIVPHCNVAAAETIDRPLEDRCGTRRFSGRETHSLTKVGNPWR